MHFMKRNHHILVNPLEKMLTLIRLVKSLPSYAVPLFLRLKDTIETTTTFKHKKVDLVKEGFNPEKIEVWITFPITWLTSDLIDKES